MPIPKGTPVIGRNEEILVSALAAFFRHGYRKTTMEDVARESRVSRQTLYARFGNKEAIYLAAVEYMLAACFAGMKAALQSEGEVWERIHKAFKASNVEAIRQLEGSEHGEELMATRSTLLLPMLRAKEEQMAKAIASALREAQTAGEIRIDSSSSAAAMAEMLVAADAGFKSDVTVRKYQARLRTAIGVLRLASR